MCGVRVWERVCDGTGRRCSRRGGESRSLRVSPSCRHTMIPNHSFSSFFSLFLGTVASWAHRLGPRSTRVSFCPLLNPLPPRQSRYQASFVADDVNNIIKESIDSVLQNASYNHNKARARREPPRPRLPPKINKKPDSPVDQPPTRRKMG